MHFSDAEYTGRFDDIDSVAAAFKGCYGVFVNTNTFAVGQQTEIYAAIKMFEQAHRTASMKHFLGNFDEKYKSIHFDSKAVVAEFLKNQASAGDGNSLTWTIVTTGPYLENLSVSLLGPLTERENGAVVWATPAGDGRIPAISVEDIGWWARYTFDHRSETSGQELKIATEFMTVDELVEKFTRATGIPAVRKRMSVEDYLKLYPAHFNRPIVKVQPDGPTVGETFAGMWRVWSDDLVSRDMDWIRRTHPTGYTLERYIKEKGFDGKLSLMNFEFLKNSEQGREV
ncbi:hypothetical protein D9757_000980 [Collybiopsis confluens]|uniref:NmrA-like domain-containing protein n=1 Tax=Collybiopsis confluens TaxID=2823264 RepID=A0A8H5MG31_9AGAR|nr:hypothetical protein D9757_000980 [Collybiopsis confluens]